MKPTVSSAAKGTVFNSKAKSVLKVTGAEKVTTVNGKYEVVVQLVSIEANGTVVAVFTLFGPNLSK